MIVKIRHLLSQAGMDKVDPILAVAMAIASSVAICLVTQSITKSWSISISFFVCLAMQLWDSFSSRIRKLRFQQNQDWPKYLDAIYSSAWAGTAIVQALLDCRNFAPKNAGWAFNYLDREISEGLDLDAALANLKVRLGNPIADRFVELSRLANQAGGRGYLAALRSQSVQLRLENATWQEIYSKQSWVIASARLAVFAPWLILMMLSMRSETAQAFTQGFGLTVLIIGLLASIFAFRLVKYFGKLPLQKRNLG